MFIVAGISFIDTANWHPYLPANTGKDGEFGWSGLLRGAGIIFFSYIGFDAASTTAREARNPQRDVPLGILGALVISAVLYIAMAAVMTGMVPYQQLGAAAPVAVALDAHPQLRWLGALVKIGAIAGMTSVILMSMLGQPRIFLAMADDGLLPPSDAQGASEVPHAARRDGDHGRVLAARDRRPVPAQHSRRADLDGHPAGVHRRLHRRAGAALHAAESARGRSACRCAPFTCVLGALICGGMTYFLPREPGCCSLIWSIIGFSIYAIYGYRHSRMRAEGK